MQPDGAVCFVREPFTCQLMFQFETQVCRANNMKLLMRLPIDTTQRWVSGKIEKKKILENVSSGGWIGSFVRLKTILEKRCEQKLSINSLLSTILVRLRPLINK